MPVDIQILQVAVRGVFLLSIAGAISFFFLAVRSFIGKRITKGVLLILASALASLVVFGMMTARKVTLERMQINRCQSHLCEILYYSKTYANDHEKTDPSSLSIAMATIMTRHDVNVLHIADSLVCPASGHKAGSLSNIEDWADYAYVSGLRETDSEGCVLAFCLPENHGGTGANIAFLGHVQWYSSEAFQKLTNTPAHFYGTTNETQLADLKMRTKIIYPKRK